MKDHANEMVVFDWDEAAGPMQVEMDVRTIQGEKWVPAAVVGEALGIQNVRQLISSLRDSEGLTEGKHFCKIVLQQVGKVVQGRERLMLSYRGVIRVAMRSDGPRAVRFRDWAEDVLYGVMVGQGGAAFLQGPDGVKGVIAKYRDAAAVIRSMMQIGKSLGRDKVSARRWAVGRAAELTGIPLEDLADDDVLSDPVCNVREFLEVCCVVAAAKTVKPDELWKAYETWCKAVDKKPYTRNAFYKNVMGWQPSVRRAQVGETRERVFQGVGLVGGLFGEG